MLIPKKNRRAIFQALFREGVLVAKKDLTCKHGSVEVPNLHAVKLMLSLKSRGYVTEKFNWQWHYFTLTNEGIEYLREYLHLPNDVLPDTLKKQNKPQTRPSFRTGGDRPERPDRPERGPRTGGRGDYRGPKKDGAPSDFNPEFSGSRGERGGFRGGRGGFRGGRGGFRGGAAGGQQ